MGRLPILLLLLTALAGCSWMGEDDNAGRYALKHDRYPDSPVDVSRVPDAVPRVEPKSRGGNKSPYRVLGKSYRVLDSALGYRERGVASWYGQKFHGHRTSQRRSLRHVQDVRRPQESAAAELCAGDQSGQWPSGDCAGQ